MTTNLSRVLAAGALLLTACTAQRLPGPMETTRSPLPPGDLELFAPGPEEVVLIRHADPVQVRPNGLKSGYSLSFYDKQRRLTAGSWIYSASGGRFEVFWPEGASIIVSGDSTGVVGSDSRGEPNFVFMELDRATFMLTDGHQIELPGGSLLSASSGPFVVEKLPRGVLRIANQSKRAAQIAFREDSMRIDPGQQIDVPLLEIGGAPDPGAGGFDEIDGPGFAVRVRGEARASQDDSSVVVRANGANEIRALGVRVQLERGEQARFSGLGRVITAEDAAPPPPAPEPERIEPPQPEVPEVEENAPETPEDPSAPEDEGL